MKNCSPGIFYIGGRREQQVYSTRITITKSNNIVTELIEFASPFPMEQGTGFCTSLHFTSLILFDVTSLYE